MLDTSPSTQTTSASTSQVFLIPSEVGPPRSASCGPNSINSIAKPTTRRPSVPPTITICDTDEDLSNRSAFFSPAPQSFRSQTPEVITTSDTATELIDRSISNSPQSQSFGNQPSHSPSPDMIILSAPSRPITPSRDLTSCICNDSRSPSPGLEAPPFPFPERAAIDALRRCFHALYKHSATPPWATKCLDFLSKHGGQEKARPTEEDVNEVAGSLTWVPDDINMEGAWCCVAYLRSRCLKNRIKPNCPYHYNGGKRSRSSSPFTRSTRVRVKSRLAARSETIRRIESGALEPNALPKLEHTAKLNDILRDASRGRFRGSARGA